MLTDKLTVGLAQIAPIWLNKIRTTEKIIHYIELAANAGCALVTFGEALLPGYPFWIERTDGARFNATRQKEFYAHYLDQAVSIDAGDLTTICAIAADRKIAVYLGIMERAADRGGHSVYCSLVYIDQMGVIQSVHRKLMPTYEERLVWAQGDGHGLRVHTLGAFTVGGLNCWENWMPLSRTALYAQGENLHVSVWPGGLHNTTDLPRFIARESRSYVIGVSGLLRRDDIPLDSPHADVMIANSEAVLANGGSCLVGPDGNWVIEPQVGEEGLFVAAIDHQKVREERHNFDIAGHYSRPDVTSLTVNRERQGLVRFTG